MHSRATATKQVGSKHKTDWWEERYNISVQGGGDSQFYGLVPHDDITRQDEGLDVDDVRVAALRPHIQPFTLEGKVAKRDPSRRAEKVWLEMIERHNNSSS